MIFAIPVKVTFMIPLNKILPNYLIIFSKIILGADILINLNTDFYDKGI